MTDSPVDQLARALDQAGRALDTVSEDNLEDPTPCSDWMSPLRPRSSDTTLTVLALAGPSLGMTWKTAVRRSSLRAPEPSDNVTQT